MSKVIWLTGLSGAGKSTISELLSSELRQFKKNVKTLDGDDIRQVFHKNLGFSKVDIHENNRFVIRLAQKIFKENDFIIISLVSPFRSDRIYARELFGSNFIEVYVYCPIEICIKRDPKGLYKKALEGKIINFIGISPSVPYQEPENPEIHLNSKKFPAKYNANKILHYLRRKKFL